jgi:hypothetical protein
MLERSGTTASNQLDLVVNTNGELIIFVTGCSSMLLVVGIAHERHNSANQQHAIDQSPNARFNAKSMLVCLAGWCHFVTFRACHGSQTPL